MSSWRIWGWACSKASCALAVVGFDLRLHLQLDLSHLKALAVDPGLHLGAGELSAGDGKAGVLVE